MATINGVEVIGDKSAHDFGLLDNQDKTEIDNGIERNREAAEDNHEDIVLHRTDTDVHVTPEWKNSLVTKEILGLYWTAAQTADIINEISIAGGAKLVKVDELPETGKEQTIYLVPKADPLERDIFDEFVWIDGKFEFIGTTKADLSGYFPITGGALTGNIIERNTDNDHLGISGSYWGHGAYLWLSGQNSGYAGAWYLSARDTEKSCDLVGSPSGVLSWGGKLVLTEDDLLNYATKAELNAKQDALSAQQIQNIADVTNKANDADVVHKSGNETISGIKTFSNDIRISKTSPFLNIFSTGYIKGQAPTSNIYSGVRFFDDINSGSANTITGGFEIEYNNDGYNKAYISSRNYAGETHKFFTVGLRVPNDDTRSIDFLPSVNAIVNLGTPTNKWADVNTVLLNGKTPETIEEQGADYIRYSSGLQICWGVVSGDQFESYGDHYGKLFSFPKSFVANTQPAISIMQWRFAGNLTQNVNIYDLTPSNCGIETDIQGGIFFIAFGKWK